MLLIEGEAIDLKINPAHEVKLKVKVSQGERY